MASTILLRTISSVADKRIVLQNSNFARPFTIPLGWTKLRFGVRLSMTDSGANVTSTPRLAIGLCSGNTNLFLDATTTHFLGFIWNAATWTRQVGPPVSYYPGAGAVCLAKRIGTTNTIVGTPGENPLIYDATTANRNAVYCDITKGSPNFTGKLFIRTVAAASDVDLNTFLTQSELASPTITNHSVLTGVSTIAIDEAANGTLDHVCVAWDRSTPQIEISDLVVVKLA